MYTPSAVFLLLSSLTPLPRAQAAGYCAALGGTLATVHNQDTQVRRLSSSP